MGIGVASGENRAAEAAKAAISSPLLESSVEGATGILLNITGGSDLGLFEVNEAAEVISSAADSNSNIIFGAVIDGSIKDEVKVTVIATGFDRQPGRIISRGRREESEPSKSSRKPETRDAGDVPDFEIGEDVLDIPTFLRDKD